MWQIVKYGFFGLNHYTPSLHLLKLLATARRTTPRHNLTRDNLVFLIDKAIAYSRAFSRNGLECPVWCRSVRNSWVVFQQFDDDDETQWIRMYHFPLDSRPKRSVSIFSHKEACSTYATVWPGSLSNKLPKQTVLQHTKKQSPVVRGVPVHCLEFARDMLLHACGNLVDAGFSFSESIEFLHVLLIWALLLLKCTRTSLIVLCNYPQPPESHIFITIHNQSAWQLFVERSQGRDLIEYLHHYYGLHIQRPDDETEILWGG